MLRAGMPVPGREQKHARGGSGRPATRALRLRTGGAASRCLRLRLRTTGCLAWRLRRRLDRSRRLGGRLHPARRLRSRFGASRRRPAVLLGVLNRLVLNRRLGQRRPGFPKAIEPPAGQERAATRVRASHSERGSRRGGPTSKKEDQCRRAGPRGERSKECTPTYHRDSRASLSRPRG
jgi:hypothetical protein